MPSKKRKYNARFPAGRIKKIMQTDEEVGKVAQAVPIIIYQPILCPPPRTLELFVESLLSKAMQVTMSRNAKTLSPSHVKQCILAESRFDFLRDLVKNIPDVSIAEEKEMLSAEDSPNSSRFSDVSGPPRRLARQDSSSSGGDLREAKPDAAADPRAADAPDPPDAPDAPDPRYDTVMDLSRKPEDAQPVVRTANFYQETLTVAADEPRGVITPNPTYAAPQPSTSSYANLTPVEPVPRVHIPPPKPDPKTVYLNRVRQSVTKPEPKTPVTPILNIDFTKDFAKPEIKVLDTAAASIVVLKSDATKQGGKRLNRQNSKAKPESKKSEAKPCSSQPRPLTDQYSGDLQIDEDYDT